MSADSPTAPDTGMLRVLSCNILAGASVKRYHEYFTRSWGAVLPGKYKLGNLDSLARSIAEFDVIGLQEADAGSIRSGFLNQTRYLAETSGLPYWSHQPNRRLSNVSHTANGLISRNAPHEVLDYPLPGRLGGRGVLLARYGDGDETLTVAVAHLSLGTQSRARQIDFIAELLQGRRNVVLMGDFNCPPESPELRSLFARTTLAAPANPTPTFPSWRPQRAIDHILVSSGIAVDRMWTLPAAFSDHLPLAAEIRVPVAAWKAAA
ncbi:MAG TPA: endonuclease/exonuclease/phosphatase family protein [Rhodanobacteraceae bacterium]|jgi:endonuclease/exonuclease/phosphatase family metal-dependent hydrolase|nr:endonuclease/exonuclease/phosphatase family protein [Rhodanobacteraceae bacterium]